ncbi:hypothetical protein [uncultured Polaribacter sp.]|uniref:hypothetical protein n=1 Tax=uncultured Polaribacter sp. TaxID=174711 RepID=UPI00261CCDC3|nr:hypothetical protein [uncultured Polaribacter sp.]
MLKKNLVLLFIASISSFFSQNNTNTPYSLFGLGVENKTGTAGLTALGNTGIAQKNLFEINIFNPANLGNMIQGSFLYEFGINGIYATLKTNTLSETTNNGNFSHVAIAFPIKHNWGMGIGLLPYTKTGYNVDIENAIEGSTDTYITRITGTGGLNKFYISSGIKALKNLSLGVDFSFLFGAINQENQLFTDSYVAISDQNSYGGVQLKTGFQYTFPSLKGIKTTLGGTLELPTSLRGSQIRSSYKTSSNGTSITIEEEVENELDNFELPTAYGLGFTTVLNKSFTSSFDYKKLFWSDTSQKLNNERYTNQSIYAFGLEYEASKNKINYFNNVKYRIGANYNTGFLQISNQQIKSYFLSAGLGLPLGKHTRSNLNISYSYGKEGTLEHKLIEENFHKITLNLNFVGKWFDKRKID